MGTVELEQRIKHCTEEMSFMNLEEAVFLVLLIARDQDIIQFFYKFFV